jgi:hypothetical protein
MQEKSPFILYSLLTVHMYSYSIVNLQNPSRVVGLSFLSFLSLGLTQGEKEREM